MPGLQEEHGLLAKHLVGRIDELASREEVLGELHRGCSGAIELVGESGIGRTRLLRELAAVPYRDERRSWLRKALFATLMRQNQM